MTSTLTHINDYLGAVTDWWARNTIQGLIAAGLLTAVITAVAVALTVMDNRRRDDELLDRLGSATPNTDDELGEAFRGWRDEVEQAPIPDLVDTDTAIATIKAGAL